MLGAVVVDDCRASDIACARRAGEGAEKHAAAQEQRRQRSCQQLLVLTATRGEVASPKGELWKPSIDLEELLELGRPRACIALKVF